MDRCEAGFADQWVAANRPDRPTAVVGIDSVRTCVRRATACAGCRRCAACKVVARSDYKSKRLVGQPRARCRAQADIQLGRRELLLVRFGGTLSGGEIEGQEFLAESKQYANANDQNSLYDEYLAKCYVALKARPDRCDNFMWITWSAFATTTWADLCTTPRVATAMKKHGVRALGVSAEQVETQLDLDHCAEVAKRLWIIVLSERQEEHLVLAPEHQALIRAHVAERAASK